MRIGYEESRARLHIGVLAGLRRPDLDEGYSLRFVIKKAKPTKSRPHGLRYSFTLHDGDATRILGFDNAHQVPAVGGKYKAAPEEHDHWHRTEDDKGRPYKFVDADKLLQDFFREAERVLKKRNISTDVVKVTKKKE